MYSHLVVIFFFFSSFLSLEIAFCAALEPNGKWRRSRRRKKKLTDEQQPKIKTNGIRSCRFDRWTDFFLRHRLSTDAKRECVSIRQRCNTRLDEIFFDSLSYSSIVSVSSAFGERKKKKKKKPTENDRETME